MRDYQIFILVDFKMINCPVKYTFKYYQHRKEGN